MNEKTRQVRGRGMKFWYVQFGRFGIYFECYFGVTEFYSSLRRRSGCLSRMTGLSK